MKNPFSKQLSGMRLEEGKPVHLRSPTPLCNYKTVMGRRWCMGDNEEVHEGEILIPTWHDDTHLLSSEGRGRRIKKLMPTGLHSNKVFFVVVLNQPLLCLCMSYRLICERHCSLFPETHGGLGTPESS